MSCQNWAIPVAVELEEKRKQTMNHPVDGQGGDTGVHKINCHSLVMLDKGFYFIQAIKIEG